MTFVENLVRFNLFSAAGIILFPVALIGLLVTYIVVVGIYNVTLHPLSKFPGPKLYGASRITWSLDVISGQSQYRLLELHKKFGDIVRIGPNELSSVNPDVWKQVYGSRIGKPQMQKDPAHYTKHDKTPSLHVSGDADHTRMRRLVAHAFSDKALRDQEPIMQQYSNLLMTRLHEVAGGGNTIDIKKWFHWTLFDLFGDLCYGESFGCLRDGKSHPWIDIIGESIQAFAWIGLAGRVPGMKKLIMYMMPKKKIEQAAWHAKFSSDLADKRMAMVTDRPDFMSFILKYNDEKGLTVPEIRSNSNVLIPGGSETTGTFLTGAIYYLCKNPDAYKKLADEVRSAFTSSDDITITKLMSLKYLTAVIEEGLRIYPPVPSNSPRVIPEEGATICGEFMPGGTSIAIAQYPMFHAPSNFVDADGYHPERWLGDARFASDDKAAFNPFSYGPRNCIGKSLAYAEMRLVLAKVFWNFDIKLAPESENWFPHDQIIIWNSPELHVKLYPIRR